MVNLIRGVLSFKNPPIVDTIPSDNSACHTQRDEIVDKQYEGWLTAAQVRQQLGQAGFKLSRQAINQKILREWSLTKPPLATMRQGKRKMIWYVHPQVVKRYIEFHEAKQALDTLERREE